jgi:Na+-driven multidrug efflux pump
MMRAFGRLLLTGWAFFALSLFVLFIFPKPMGHFLGGSLTILKESLIVLVLGSVFFGIPFSFSRRNEADGAVIPTTRSSFGYLRSGIYIGYRATVL